VVGVAAAGRRDAAGFAAGVVQGEDSVAQPAGRLAVAPSDPDDAAVVGDDQPEVDAVGVGEPADGCGVDLERSARQVSQ
jgi:hypothetical protein